MNAPHSVIFCDIDGCLNDGKHRALDLVALATIRQQIRDLAAQGVALSLCTGRPQPYAEAMAQILDLHTPIICEYGAMVYDPLTGAATTPLAAGERDEINRLKRHLSTLIGHGNAHFAEPGKEFAISITGPGIIDTPPETVARLMEQYRSQSPGFDVNWTYSIAAIDIAPGRISKRTGAEMVLQQAGSDPARSFAIGDSNGDLPILEFVTHAACPANAEPAVKQICKTVATAPTTGGVVEILHTILGITATG
jgi:HAD superfamily hydrolase (TIGR01484 family)